MGFVHLHSHTDYSLLDGLSSIKDYVKKVKDSGMTAAAITDHGTMSGAVEFFETCEKEGIKPIIGEEYYEAPDSRFTKDKVDGVAYHHLILLAKNETGYKNLCYLTTRSETEGQYYKPRIDFDLLKDHHEGLICLSACLAGRIPTYIMNGEYDKADEWVEKYKGLFGEDFYLEIQNHGIPEELTVASYMPILAQKHNVKLVCTNDCHYVNTEDAEAHEWLLCMQTKKTINEPHMVYKGDYSVKTEEEMRKLFPSLQEAFDNTVEIADKCDFKFEFGHYRMPKVVIPKEWGDDYFGYMESEAWKGYEKRYPVGHAYRDMAKDRLNYELGIIKQMGFAEYFLDTRKTIMWAREHNIIVGPGRGSGAGSCMNYCLGITDLEPLRYGLLFERFLNPERVSMPDIDVDYEMLYKDAVIKSEADSNGIENFAKIRTFQTLQAKGILRDITRTAGLGVDVGSKLAGFIGKEDKTIQDAYDKNEEFRDYIEKDDTGNLKNILKIAQRLEGVKKSGGTHACGHIPTPQPCETLFPCSLDKNSGYLICQYNMAEAEHLGNLKKDLLMLKNLAIIDVAHKLIKENYGIDMPFWNETILDDKDALKMIASGDTYGVFQVESAGMQSLMKQMKPNCFEDIIAAVSLYRPGPIEYIPQFIENKKNPSKIKYLHPSLQPILSNTYGVITYQEQVMQITQALAGFTMGEADVVRKAMGKKKMDIMEKESTKFIYGDEQFEGCLKKTNITEEQAKKLWADMAEFGKYAFNKSHAAAYAAITMQTAYLKYHYPKEFYAGLLTTVMKDKDDFVKYSKDCRSKGIKITVPDINSSGRSFTVTKDGNITYGLVSITGLGEDVVDKIITEREQNGEYESLQDFVMRNPSVGKAAVINLIKSGAFDFTGINRPMLAENVSPLKDKYKKYLTKKNGEIEGQESLFDLFQEEFSGDCAEFVYKLQTFPDYDNLISKYIAEKEATGDFISGHPLENHLVNDIDYVHLLDIANLLKKEEEEENNIIDNDGAASDNDRNDFLINTKDEDRQIKDKDYVYIHGVITDIEHKISQKGNAYTRYKLEDETGEISVSLYGSVHTTYKDSFGKNDIVTIYGQVSISNDFGVSVTASKIVKEADLTRGIYIRPVDTEFDGNYANFKAKVERAIKAGHNDVSPKGRKIPYFYENNNLFPVYINITKDQQQKFGLLSRCFFVGYVNDYDRDMGLLQSRFGSENVKIANRTVPTPSVNKNNDKIMQ